MNRKIIYSICFFLLSCHKKEFKTYIGTYDCSSYVFEESPGEPNVYTITTDHEVTVIKDGKTISVLGQKVPITSIEPEVNYMLSSGVIGDSIYFNLLFRNDSIYHEIVRKIGEKRTTTAYFGAKIYK